MIKFNLLSFEYLVEIVVNKSFEIFFQKLPVMLLIPNHKFDIFLFYLSSTYQSNKKNDSPAVKRKKFHDDTDFKNTLVRSTRLNE